MLAVPTIGGGIIAGIKRAAAKPVGEVRVVSDVFAECAACAREQAHMRRFTAFIGIDRVNEPDRLGFAVLGVDANPCWPHVVLDKGAQRGAHGCGEVRGVSACFAVLVDVYEEDGGVLLIGQHCILALSEGVCLNAVHPRAAFAVFVGVVGRGEVSRAAGVNDIVKRTIGAVLATGALLLAGCSETAEHTAEPTPETEMTTTVTDKEFRTVGDTIPVDCQGNNCAGELEVEQIVLHEACKVQLVAEEIPEELQLVQISGVLTATEEILDSSGAEIGVRPEMPEAWDSDQFKSTGEWGGGCDVPQGYEQWNAVPAKPGEKVRVYGSFLIPQAQVLGIANSRFDLTEIEKTPASSTSSAAPESSPAAEQQAPVQQEAPVPEQPAEASAPAPAPVPEEEPVVGYTEAPGQVAPKVMEKQIASCGDPSIHETGTTFFTDGTSGWTENCVAQMM